MQHLGREGEDTQVKVTTEELSDRQVVMTVEVEEEQAQQALRQAARRLSHRMRIPGFRPGRAPYAIVLRTVGEDSLRSEAFEAIGQQLYEEALKEAEIDAYAQGSLEDVQWDPLTFRVTVPLPPVVKLGDYGSLSVPTEPILVLDEDVAEALDDLRQRNAEWVPVDRAAEYDDMVDVDIKGVVGEEEIMNQQNWERLLRKDGSGGLPGFDAAFVGMTAGESSEFDLTYPEDSGQWAGQTAHFTAQLHGVKAKELPELNDDFAQTVGEFDTLAALQEATRQDIRDRRTAEADYEGKVLDALIEQSTVEFPPLVLDNELNDLLDEHDRRLRQQGMPLDDFLRMTGKTRDAYREENRPSAERKLKRSLVLSEFVRQEGLTLDDQKISEEIERQVALQPDETRERLRTLLDSPGGRQAIGNNLLTREAISILVAMAKGEYEKPDLPAEAPEAEGENDQDKGDTNNDMQESADQSV